MDKNFLLIFSLIVILLAAYLTLAFNNNLSQTVSKSGIDTAINQSKHLYRQEKEKGRDFSNGLCLSDALMPNWVVDIVHDPRLPIDDLAENQCTSYREGRSKHFVELDLDGNLVRAK
ncbi:hypothetical protein HYW41_03235 [Candidatus Daviesbacteria bacterium]|nr:hypothetical protein [Candidatus Daviesbacteria bacterium]